MEEIFMFNRRNETRPTAAILWEALKRFQWWNLLRSDTSPEAEGALADVFSRVDPSDIIGDEEQALYTATRNRFRANPDPVGRARRNLPEWGNYLNRRQKNDKTYFRRMYPIALSDAPTDSPPPGLDVPAPDEVCDLIADYLEAVRRDPGNAAANRPTRARRKRGNRQAD